MQLPINPLCISAPSTVAFSQDNAMETAANRDKNPNQHSQLITSKQKFYIGLKKIKRMNVHISNGPVFCWLRIKHSPYNCHLFKVSLLCSLPQKDMWEMIVVQFQCKSMAERVCPPLNLCPNTGGCKNSPLLFCDWVDEQMGDEYLRGERTLLHYSLTSSAHIFAACLDIWIIHLPPANFSHLITPPSPASAGNASFQWRSVVTNKVHSWAFLHFVFNPCSSQ